jgi:hypothetical protein
MSEVVNNPMQIANELAEKHRQEQERQRQEAAVTEWVDPTSQQSVEDFNAYMEAQPYQDANGQAHAPKTGEFIGPNGKYFDKRRDAHYESTQDRRYEELSMTELADELAYAELTEDKTVAGDISDILLDKMVDFADKNSLDNDAQTNLQERILIRKAAWKDHYLDTNGKEISDEARKEAEAEIAEAWEIAPLTMKKLTKKEDVRGGSVTPLKAEAGAEAAEKNQSAEAVDAVDNDPGAPSEESEVSEPSAEGEKTPEYAKGLVEQFLPRAAAGILQREKMLAEQEMAGDPEDPEFVERMEKANKNLEDAKKLFDDNFDEAATILGWSEEEKDAKRQKLLSQQPEAREAQKSGLRARAAALAAAMRGKLPGRFGGQKAEQSEENPEDQKNGKRKWLAAAAVGIVAVGIGAGLLMRDGGDDGGERGDTAIEQQDDVDNETGNGSPDAEGESDDSDTDTSSEDGDSTAGHETAPGGENIGVLEANGSTIWEDAKANLIKHGTASPTDAQVMAETQRILDLNDLTWEDAKKLPVGYEFRV